MSYDHLPILTLDEAIREVVPLKPKTSKHRPFHARHGNTPFHERAGHESDYEPLFGLVSGSVRGWEGPLP